MSPMCGREIINTYQKEVKIIRGKKDKLQNNVK
jgi:hypothetical protein